MNKWIKIITPTILAAIVATFILMFSGHGTSTITDIEGDPVTQTIVKLDVNVFAAIMIVGVALTVLISGFLVQRADKPSPKPSELK